MVSLTCHATREEGVTLVTGHVRNPDRPRRVRLANELDGPVWPPRVDGVPAEGWDDDGVELVLAADELRAVGYATPADPADDPLAIVSADRVDLDSEPVDDSPAATPGVTNTPNGIVRELGSPRPPRDAVPTPEVDADPGDATEAPTDADTGDRDVAERQSIDVSEREQIADGGAVESWLAGVEQRIDAGETLTADARLEAGADAVSRIGGLDAVRELDGRLADDAARLRTLAARAETLAERAETVDVPIEMIERLA